MSSLIHAGSTGEKDCNRGKGKEACFLICEFPVSICFYREVGNNEERMLDLLLLQGVYPPLPQPPKTEPVFQKKFVLTQTK